MIREQDQGWSFSEQLICSRCVSDPYLKQFIQDAASVSPCTFCRRRGPNSVPFDTLMEIIAGTIFEYYTHAVNEAGWDSREGGYLGDTFDTWELIRDRFDEPSNREAVNDAIIESLGDETWCQLHMYSVDGVDRYIASWTDFCSTVKHKIRYFFDMTKQEEDFPETIPVPRMLDELRDIISEVSLVGTLPVTTRFYRVRQHSRAEVCNTWQSLGPPPDSAAISNRMSAAGISMFYAAFDMATARAEVSVNISTGEHVLTGAEWTNTRELNVLDLTKLPAVPSIYATLRHERDSLVFLHKFVRAITLPVEHDGREHIEYVPTQILTEYFRHRFMPNGTSTIDGIVYPSTHRRNGRSIAIFASQKDLNPDQWDNKPTPMLVLDPQSVVRVKPSTRRHSTQHGSNSSVVAGT